MAEEPQAGPRYRFQSIDWWDHETHQRHTYGGVQYIPTAVLRALSDEIAEEIRAREVVRLHWELQGGVGEVEALLRVTGSVARQSLRDLRRLQRARFVLTGELGTGVGFVPLVPGVDAEDALEDRPDDLTEPPRKPDTAE